MPAIWLIGGGLAILSIKVGGDAIDDAGTGALKLAGAALLAAGAYKLVK